MQTNIFWSGVEYYSLENSIVDVQDDITITSTIVGLYQGKLYRVEYTLWTNRYWQVTKCLIRFQYQDEIKHIELYQREAKWFLNKEYTPAFDHCFDIDIPLTPFTNTLPINRLKLRIGNEKEINVIYCDLMQDTIKCVKQKYRRISEEIYKYENIPNDFEAEIKVDCDGFVVDYPQLFTRSARIASNYRIEKLPLTITK